MSLLRQISFLAATHAFLYRVQHVAGYTNDTADALSRLQIDRFRTLQPAAHPTPTPVPGRLPKLFAKAHALPEGKPSGLSRKMPSRLKSVTGWRGVGHETWRAAGIALRLDLARWLHASAPPWEVAAFPDFTFRLDIGTLQRDASADELHLAAQRHLATLPSKPSGIRTRGAAGLLANANAFSEDNPPKATMAKPRHRAGGGAPTHGLKRVWARRLASQGGGKSSGGAPV
ncbi:hypothetical protein FJT64_005615 [Amphibalanus amphitrite]|uniref:Uncharacterized protein n=1 Tax=Amphibalanus amphitrite TaxID=1232801 RepID=A0A6A4VZD6_AMPAM|nr:hypothetical protein FJT64_005615 [Amphibalanus amphitrite]